MLVLALFQSVNCKDSLVTHLKASLLSFFKLMKKYRIFSLHYFRFFPPAGEGNFGKQAKFSSCSKGNTKAYKQQPVTEAFVPGVTGEHKTEVLEDIEAKVTKKPSQEYSRTPSRILGSLSNLDRRIALDPQVRTLRNCSGIIPEH